MENRNHVGRKFKAPGDLDTLQRRRKSHALSLIFICLGVECATKWPSIADEELFNILKLDASLDRVRIISFFFARVLCLWQCFAWSLYSGVGWFLAVCTYARVHAYSLSWSGVWTRGAPGTSTGSFSASAATLRWGGAGNGSLQRNSRRSRTRSVIVFLLKK